MRKLRFLAAAASLSLLMISCGAPEQPPKSVVVVDSLARDSLASLDSLRSRAGGWEVQLMEGLNEFKVTCRVRVDSLVATTPALLNDSALILLRSTATVLADSLRSNLIQEAATADEAKLETLQLLQTLVADSETSEDLKDALVLFCEWASVKQDTIPIIQ